MTRLPCLLVCATCAAALGNAWSSSEPAAPGLPGAPEGSGAPDRSAAAARNPVVVMKTSMGEIKAELWPDKAPVTVSNFLSYVDSGFYDGLIFHRVIRNFMIQGGGFTPDMKQKPARDPIKNEARADVPNARGTLAMARTPYIHSATCQFFINVVDNPFLNHRDETPAGFGYCVFGKIIEGMAVVDKIREVETHSVGGHGDVPVKPVTIDSVTRAQ